MKSEDGLRRRQMLAIQAMLPEPLLDPAALSDLDVVWIRILEESKRWLRSIRLLSPVRLRAYLTSDALVTLKGSDEHILRF